MKFSTLATLASFTLIFAPACDKQSSGTTTTTTTTSTTPTPTPTPSPTAAVEPEVKAAVPTIDMAVAIKEAMKRRAVAAGWEWSGDSGMTLGTQKQSTLSFKKGAETAQIYIVTPSGGADEGTLKPRSLAEQAATFTKKGVPSKVNGPSLVAVTVKKGAAIDPAASKTLFETVVK